MTALLAFQIDHWDAVKKQTAVWVALDTVQNFLLATTGLVRWMGDGILAAAVGAARARPPP